ncbi:DNA helicase [Tanacetum coccineum]
MSSIETENILNHVETFATFDALDNVLSGYGPGFDVPSVGIPLASCSSRITGLYLDVFQKCSDFCGVKSQRECSTTFRVINRTEDSQLYFDVYHKYSRVSGKVPCVQKGTGLRGSSTFVGRIGDGLDKRKLQPSGHSDVFEAYLALCSSGAGSRRSRSLSHITTVFNSNLVHTDLGVSNNGSSASRRGRNVQVRSRLNSSIYVQSTSRRTGHRVLTSGSTIDITSVASAGTSYTYSDFGDCDRRCQYCGASFWMHHFGGIDNSQLKPGIVEGLIHFLDAHNELVQLFRIARDKCRELYIPEFKIRLYNAKGARGYELPTSNTLGAMVFESGISENTDFDVIIQHRDGPPQRVNKLHPSYMSLQFPLLFIYGQPGYHTELTLKSANDVGRGKMNQMDYIRKKQNDIRSDYLSGLYDAISRGERDGYEVGGRIILPIFYRRSAIHIKRFMSKYPHLTASDRADVVCQVFEQKIQALIAFLKEERIFGDVTGASKIRIAEDVNQFISAELPDPRIDPEGYKVVSELMMHGPFGARRDTSVSTIRNEFQLDNSYVVPYNRDLLLAFQAHINVEYCGWSMLIKYMFKYISKGTERVFACVSRPIGELSTAATSSRYVIDEISNYVESRFICAHEAYWRIFKLKSVIDLPGKKSTTLIEWFAFNEANEVGRHLSYLEFPSEFVWYSGRKSWSPRKNNKSCIRRLGYTLYEIEIILSNCGKLLHIFGLPSPPQDLLAQLANRLLMEERIYNQEELAQIKDESVPLLNAEQIQIYDLIINADTNNQQKLIFVYGHVASLALDRSLRDIVNKPSFLFGGKLVLLGGDFRQTLPVKKGASKIEVISSCISESALWPSFKVFTLKHNMWLARPDISLEERSLVNSFASWLLDIGDGKIGEPADEDLENTSWVHIPPAYYFALNEQGLSKLIDFIYDQSTLHTPSVTTLQQKVIVCPKNETIYIINSKVLAMVPGESTIYMSQDEATPTGNDRAETEILYPIEHLNTFKLPVFPPYQLELKVGAPVMLLRNVNIAGGLCNGTRMIVDSS